MDTQFDHGAFADLHYLLFDLFAGLFHDLFDPGGGDTAVRNQSLKRKAGDLPAEGGKGGKYDWLRGVVHDEGYPRSSLDGADITTFPADDMALYFVAFAVVDGV